MGDLVGIDPPQVLIGGAGVVNLVKIGGVVPAGGGGHHILLVKKGAPRSAGDQARQVHLLPVLVQKGQLPQLKGVAGGVPGDAQVLKGAGVGELDGLPFEEQVVALGKGVAGGVALGGGPVVVQNLPVRIPVGPQGGPVLPVLGDLDVIVAGAQTGVVKQGGGVDGLRKGDFHRLAVGKGLKGLGIGGGTQAKEGGGGVDKGEQKHQHPVPPVQRRTPPGKGHGGGREVRRLSGELEQGVGIRPAAKHQPVPAEKAEDTHQQHQGKNDGGGEIGQHVHRASSVRTAK